MLGHKNAAMFELLWRMLELLDEKVLTRNELSEKLGVSPQVVGRQIKLLRDQFNMRISSSNLGYGIEDWGILDHSRFTARRKARKNEEI